MSFVSYLLLLRKVSNDELPITPTTFDILPNITFDVKDLSKLSTRNHLHIIYKKQTHIIIKRNTFDQSSFKQPLT